MATIYAFEIPPKTKFDRRPLGEYSCHAPFNTEV
jgi:hypothetical protein